MSLAEELRGAMGFDVLGVAEAGSYDAEAPAGHRARDYLPGAASIIVAGFRRPPPSEKETSSHGKSK